MKSKRLIVVSLDALSSIDFDMFSKLPNFKKFIRHAACCRQVRSVYPSLTYPAHTSIVTGRTPAHHGIVNNILLQPERQPQMDESDIDICGEWDSRLSADAQS